MKRFKKILALGSIVTVVGVSPISAFANTMVTQPTNNVLNEYSLRWNHGGEIDSRLSFSGGKANCRVYISASSVVTKIVADVILEKKSGSGYDRVVTWSGISVSGNTLSTAKSYTAGPGTYRLRVVAKVYNGNNYQTISSSTVATN